MPSDQVFERAMLNIQTKLCQWSLDDFISLYMESLPIFCAVNVEFEQYYFNVDESKEQLIDLITYQLNIEYDNPDLIFSEVKNFLECIYNVCEKKIPKCNSIYIVSPPSSGKNYFMDAILSFYLNVGNVANYNKNNNFPFQDAINRRMNLWNEPNFMPSSIDTLKMLCGGDTMHVNIKFQKHVPLYRTPLIVLSNKHVFKDKAFNDRMIKYDWRPAPQLKLLRKKPHPFVWPILLHDYGIHVLKQHIYDTLSGIDEYDNHTDDE